LLTGLTTQVLETAFEVEMSEHLGHDRGERSTSGNMRDGSSAKTVRIDIGRAGRRPAPGSSTSPRGCRGRTATMTTASGQTARSTMVPHDVGFVGCSWLLDSPPNTQRTVTHCSPQEIADQ
jgi:hypothetical protein